MSGSGDDFWGQFFLATTWVLRLKLRSADLVASALDHWAILLAYFDATRLGLWENHRPKHFMQPLSDTASCSHLELWFSSACKHTLHFSAHFHLSFGYKSKTYLIFNFFPSEARVCHVIQALPNYYRRTSRAGEMAQQVKCAPCEPEGLHLVPPEPVERRKERTCSKKLSYYRHIYTQ